MVELKRPMTRGFEDLGSYVVDLHRAFVNAKARALLSSPRFCEQDEVIMIAGVGDWWTYFVLNRDSCQVFRSIEYDAIVAWGEENLGDIDDTTDHVLEHPQALKRTWSEVEVTRRAQQEKSFSPPTLFEAKGGLGDARAHARRAE